MNLPCPLCAQEMTRHRDALPNRHGFQIRYECAECATFGCSRVLHSLGEHREAVKRVLRVIERWEGKIGRELADEVRAALGRGLS